MNYHQQAREGVDYILLRKVKQSTGGRNRCCSDVSGNNKVKPYTTPDTMRRDHAITDVNEYIDVEYEVEDEE